MRTYRFYGGTEMKFGEQFGGRYVPEVLIPPLEELENEYRKSKN